MDVESALSIYDRSKMVEYALLLLSSHGGLWKRANVVKVFQKMRSLEFCTTESLSSHLHPPLPISKRIFNVQRQPLSIKLKDLHLG